MHAGKGDKLDIMQCNLFFLSLFSFKMCQSIKSTRDNWDQEVTAAHIRVSTLKKKCQALKALHFVKDIWMQSSTISCHFFSKRVNMAIMILYYCSSRVQMNLFWIAPPPPQPATYWVLLLRDQLVVCGRRTLGVNQAGRRQSKASLKSETPQSAFTHG